MSQFIRIASQIDLHRLNLIHNQGIESKVSNAFTELQTLSETKIWLDSHSPDKYPVYVYENDNEVLAWLSLSPYRKERKALSATAEISFYVENNFQGRGIGGELIDYCIDIAPTLSLSNLFAIVLEHNYKSIRLLEKHKFEKWGFLPKIANIDGKVMGQYYYGINL